MIRQVYHFDSWRVQMKPPINSDVVDKKAEVSVPASHSFDEKHILFAVGIADSPGLVVHEIPVDLPRLFRGSTT
jgi:hypothetical protein